MNKVVARTLRPGEGRKLQQLKRQLSNAVNCRHARIILLSRGGICNREIATRVGCTPQWVCKIIHRFNEGGIEAITWYPYYCARAGPVKFMADVLEQIAEVALSPPVKLIGMSVWSLAKLREYLIAQKIIASISIERLRQILQERKIRWCHTKTWKDRMTRISGQNTAGFAGSTRSDRAMVDASVSTNSARSTFSPDTACTGPEPDMSIVSAPPTRATAASVT
jgi:transposase